MDINLNLGDSAVIVNGGKEYTGSATVTASAGGWSSGNISVNLPKGLYITTLRVEPQVNNQSYFIRTECAGATVWTPVFFLACNGCGRYINTSDITSIPYSIYTNNPSNFSVKIYLTFTKIY